MKKSLAGTKKMIRLNSAALWKRLAQLDRSQNSIAKEIGITPGYLSMLVNDQRRLSVAVRRRIGRGVEDVHPASSVSTLSSARTSRVTLLPDTRTCQLVTHCWIRGQSHCAIARVKTLSQRRHPRCSAHCWR